MERGCSLLGYVAVGDVGLILIALKARCAALLPGGHQVRLIAESRWIQVPLRVCSLSFEATLLHKEYALGFTDVICTIILHLLQSRSSLSGRATLYARNHVPFNRTKGKIHFGQWSIFASEKFPILHYFVLQMLSDIVFRSA